MNKTGSSGKGLDPRTNVFRADLAARHLEKTVRAENFVDGFQARLTAAIASLHKAPDHDMPVLTQLVYGDDVTVYEEQGNWAWVQNNRDHYVGYLPRGCLSRKMVQPTHKVIALATFAYGMADIKTPLPYRLYMNSRLHVVGEQGNFWQLADGRFVCKGHVGTFDDVADDFVAVAELYAEVPYLWGGRTCDGIDCSGLVQVAFEAAGLACPRDADMQMAIDGHDLDAGGMDEMRRGDLVFWKGHVAIMLDETTMLHANAHHMKVVVENFHIAAARIASGEGGDILAIRRPSRRSAGDP